MELKTCKEKTQKGEITWSLHLYMWPLRGSKHGAVRGVYKKWQSF